MSYFGITIVHMETLCQNIVKKRIGSGRIHSVHNLASQMALQNSDKSKCWCLIHNIIFKVFRPVGLEIKYFTIAYSEKTNLHVLTKTLHLHVCTEIYENKCTIFD